MFLLQCSDKWHDSLAPSMIEAGQWAAGQDKLLIRGLAEAAVEGEWQVDWGNLVPGRSAELVS
jgi:hypothetical protein